MARRISRKMKINRLAQDELSYELTIRGIGTSTCEQMRSALARALQMEKEGTSIQRPPYPYTFSEDEAAIGDKIKDITIGIESFGEGKNSNQYAKWETKLNHVLSRTEQMKVEEDDRGKQKVKSDFMAKILELMSELDHKAGQYDVQDMTPAEISVLQINESSSSNDEGEIGPAFGSPRATGAVRRVVKSVPTARWNLYFSGEKKTLSLNAFLQRVDELMVARHISKEELIETAIDLFQGKALIWYRAVRKEVRTWDDLVKLLREEFQPSDYNERLLTSIAQLRTLGRRLEARREAVEAFTLPSRKNNNTLEPDLAYVGVASSSSEDVCDTVDVNGASRQFLCFNCNQPGHKAIGCLEKKRLYCYRCKREGVTTKNCPNCTRAGNEQRRS